MPLKHNNWPAMMNSLLSENGDFDAFVFPHVYFFTESRKSQSWPFSNNNNEDSLHFIDTVNRTKRVLPFNLQSKLFFNTKRTQIVFNHNVYKCLQVNYSCAEFKVPKETAQLNHYRCILIATFIAINAGNLFQV